MKRTPVRDEEENGNGETEVGEIEKGIKVPDQRMRGSVKYPFDKMKVGDSFLVKNPSRKSNVLRNTIYGAIASYKKSHTEKRFIVRKSAPGEFRVWRVKNEEDDE